MNLFQLLGEKQKYRQYTSAGHISNWEIEIPHQLVYKEQNMLHFCNVDDKFHCLERRSQHMIFKIKLSHLFPFHVNYLLYLLWFLIVSAAMHLTILENTLKCYKWHNHTSFFDDLSLNVLEDVLKNGALCH